MHLRGYLDNPESRNLEESNNEIIFPTTIIGGLFLIGLAYFGCIHCCQGGPNNYNLEDANFITN